MRDFNDLPFTPENHILDFLTVIDPINKDSLRYIKETFGENFHVWFVAQDWLKSLGYKKPGTLISNTKKEQKKIFTLNRDMATLSIDRLEEIVYNCQKSESQLFIQWVKFIIFHVRTADNEKEFEQVLTAPNGKTLNILIRRKRKNSINLDSKDYYRVSDRNLQILFDLPNTKCMHDIIGFYPERYIDEEPDIDPKYAEMIVTWDGNGYGQSYYNLNLKEFNKIIFNKTLKVPSEIRSWIIKKVIPNLNNFTGEPR